MSPWNIISKFRSKAPAEAAKVAQVTAALPSEDTPLIVSSDEVRIAQSARVADAMIPQRERVFVRITTHKASAENSALNELRIDTVVATKAEEAGNAQVPGGVLLASNARPDYDIGTKTKAAKTSRVDLSSTRPKAAHKQVEMSSGGRGEYLSASVSLDDDIKQLRAALAKKLETQNDQLREMLSRFEAR